jgi:hypothetical protein
MAGSRSHAPAAAAAHGGDAEFAPDGASWLGGELARAAGGGRAFTDDYACE